MSLMIKIIIVEDEPILLKGLQYKVNWTDLGCIVVATANDGIKGLKLISKYNPHIVITDNRMPFLDGLEMLKKAKNEGQKFESIIITGYEEFDYAKQAINLGVHDFLLKPIDMEELKFTTTKLINKIKHLRSLEEYNKNTILYSKILNLNLLSDQQGSFVRETINYIKDNYSKKITVSEISDYLKVSTVYLNTKFKEETSYNIGDFIIRYKILKAIEIMQKENIMVYEIANQVGFSDYKYFSQVFKKIVGQSPTQFIN